MDKIDIADLFGYNILYQIGDMMKKFNNIQTKDHIADLIRNEILAGNMKAGEELTQEVLAETLGVSRMPVREALQTLAQEGFVERMQNRHIQVVALDSSQIKEIFCVLASIETDVAKMLLAKEVDTALLDIVLQQIVESRSKVNLVDLEMSFHNILLRLLENKYLKQMHDKLMRGYIAYAIEHLGDEQKRKQNLINIIEALINREIAQLKPAFEAYYQYYAKQF